MGLCPEDKSLYTAMKLYPLLGSEDAQLIRRDLLEARFPNYIENHMRLVYTERDKKAKEVIWIENRAYMGELSELSISELQARLCDELAAVDWWSEGKCDANYDYWLKMSSWSPEQAVLLLSGLEPKRLDMDKVIRYAKWVDKVSTVLELWEILSSALEYSKLTGTPVPITPNEYITWYREKGFSLPKGIEPELTPVSMRATTKEKQTRKTPWHGKFNTYLKNRISEGKQDKPNIHTVISDFRREAGLQDSFVEDVYEDDSVMFRDAKKTVSRRAISNQLTTEWKKILG